MKNLLLVIAAAIMIASCQKQAKDILRPETTSRKVKNNTTLETTATLGLTATVSGSSIICTYDFAGLPVQVSQLYRRYTDTTGQVQTITFTWDNGTTTQSDGWVIVQQAIWSWSGPVSSFTITNCQPGTHDLRLWASLSDGSIAFSDLVTITIP